MARSTPKRDLAGFYDTCVIYQDGHEWVAHSIMTDQIGVGDSVLDAYVALRRALTALLEAASDDPAITVFSLAPPAVRQRALKAKPLPRELLEIAEMRLGGKTVSIDGVKLPGKILRAPAGDLGP